MHADELIGNCYKRNAVQAWNTKKTHCFPLKKKVGFSCWSFTERIDLPEKQKIVFYNKDKKGRKKTSFNRPIFGWWQIQDSRVWLKAYVLRDYFEDVFED